MYLVLDDQSVFDLLTLHLFSLLTCYRGATQILRSYAFIENGYNLFRNVPGD